MRKGLALAFLIAFAVIGILCTVSIGLHAVKRHYAVECVDEDDADPITKPAHAAGTARL